MASIKPGNYTVREILRIADFDLLKKATNEHSPGEVDRRRVRIGGLPFDDEDKVIHIPVTTDEVVISLDGRADTVLDVDLDEADQKMREYSFMTAADADAPAPRTEQGGQVAAPSDDADAEGPDKESTFTFDRSLLK